MDRSSSSTSPADSASPAAAGHQSNPEHEQPCSVSNPSISMTSETNPSADPSLPPTTVPVDLQELSAYALPPGQECIVASTKIIAQVPVRKPSKNQWVRTWPELADWRPWPLLELKEDGEVYLVASAVHADLAGEGSFISARLVPTVTSTGVFTFWPIRLPDSTGKLNPWHEAAANAADIARSQWVRIVANMQMGGYDVHTTPFDLAPKWPTLPHGDLLKIAFRGRCIDSPDHPVVRRLKGLAL
jgi:hypothetical protein